jgi:hypothetical protein
MMGGFFVYLAIDAHGQGDDWQEILRNVCNSTQMYAPSKNDPTFTFHEKNTAPLFYDVVVIVVNGNTKQGECNVVAVGNGCAHQPVRNRTARKTGLAERAMT